MSDDDPTSYNEIPFTRATAIMSQLTRRRALQATVVPTNDHDVRTQLRSRNEPMTLFAEGPAERRDRLKELVLDEHDSENEDVDMADVAEGERDQGRRQKQLEEYYTEGSEALLHARRDMARYSLPRARKRVFFQKEVARIPLKSHVEHRNRIKAHLRGFELYGSQSADRPVSKVRFAPDGKTALSANWSGNVSLCSVPELETRGLYAKGHSGQVRGLDWFPGATVQGNGVIGTSVNFASGGAEGSIQLWPLEATQEEDTPMVNGDTEPTHSKSEDTQPPQPYRPAPLATISSHTAGIRDLAFHPSGSYIASASDDNTWRLFDIRQISKNLDMPLMTSDSHTRAPHTLSFSPDGSLLATAGADAVGRIWDLRSGRTIMVLTGHMREIHASDWSPDGYRVVTGSADGMCWVWDVRMVRETARVPANGRGVTDVRWWRGRDDVFGNEKALKGLRKKDRQDATATINGTGKESGESEDMDVSTDTPDAIVRPPKSGTFLLTAGFDRSIKIFSADDWAPVRTLTGHGGHVLSTDMDPDGKWIVSGGYDRTVKTWSREDGMGV